MRRSILSHLKGLWLLFLPLYSPHAQWIRTDGPVDNYGGRSITAIGDTFLLVVDGVYRSTDYCRTWTKIKTDSTFDKNVRSLELNGTTLFATGGLEHRAGLFCSTNYGTSWSIADSTLMSLSFGVVLENNKTLYAGTRQGLYRSTDNGKTWLVTTLKDAIQSCAIKDSVILAGAYENGVWRSIDYGATWEYFRNGMKTTTIIHGVHKIPSVNYLAIKGKYVFAGMSTNGIYRSTIDGTEWVNVLSITNQIQTLLVQGDIIIATTLANGQIRTGRIYYSVDNGDTWKNCFHPYSEVRDVYDLLIKNDTIYAAANNGIWRQPLAEISTALHTRHCISPIARTPSASVVNGELIITGLKKNTRLSGITLYTPDGKSVFSDQFIAPSHMTTAASYSLTNTSTGLYIVTFHDESPSLRHTVRFLYAK